jgi:hypothetical protein
MAQKIFSKEESEIEMTKKCIIKGQDLPYFLSKDLPLDLLNKNSKKLTDFIFQKNF